MPAVGLFVVLDPRTLGCDMIRGIHILFSNQAEPESSRRLSACFKPVAWPRLDRLEGELQMSMLTELNEAAYLKRFARIVFF